MSPFVADTNLFSDAYLVLRSENGYKAKSQNYTPECCGFYTHETTTSWGKIMSILPYNF